MNVRPWPLRTSQLSRASAARSSSERDGFCPFTLSGPDAVFVPVDAVIGSALPWLPFGLSEKASCGTVPPFLKGSGADSGSTSRTRRAELALPERDEYSFFENDRTATIERPETILNKCGLPGRFHVF